MHAVSRLCVLLLALVVTVSCGGPEDPDRGPAPPRPGTDATDDPGPAGDPVQDDPVQDGTDDGTDDPTDDGTDQSPPTCDDGARACAGVCALCPTGEGIASFGCDGSQCVVQACWRGYRHDPHGCEPWRVERVRDQYLVTDSAVAMVEDGPTLHLTYAFGHPSEGDRIYGSRLAYERWGDDPAYLELDPNRGPSSAQDLVLDSAGAPHILFGSRCESGSPALCLFHAWEAGGGWNGERVYEGEPAQIDAERAPDGSLHVVFHAKDRTALVHGVLDTSGWELEVVDDAGEVGLYPSIAFDAAGNAHVVYQDASNLHVKYAVRSSGRWQLGRIDTSGDVGLHNRIAVDSGGWPHVVYAVLGDSVSGRVHAEGVRYARLTEQGWTHEVVDPNPFRGEYLSLALDAEDAPHVAYSARIEDGVHYATRGAPGWILQEVDSGEDEYFGTSLSLDARGLPLLVFVGGPSGLGGHELWTAY